MPPRRNNKPPTDAQVPADTQPAAQPASQPGAAPMPQPGTIDEAAMLAAALTESGYNPQTVLTIMTARIGEAMDAGQIRTIEDVDRVFVDAGITATNLREALVPVAWGYVAPMLQQAPPPPVLTPPPPVPAQAPAPAHTAQPVFQGYPQAPQAPQAPVFQGYPQAPPAQQVQGFGRAPAPQPTYPAQQPPHYPQPHYPQPQVPAQQQQQHYVTQPAPVPQQTYQPPAPQVPRSPFTGHPDFVVPNSRPLSPNEIATLLNRIGWDLCLYLSQVAPGAALSVTLSPSLALSFGQAGGQGFIQAVPYLIDVTDPNDEGSQLADVMQGSESALGNIVVTAVEAARAAFRQNRTTAQQRHHGSF